MPAKHQETKSWYHEIQQEYDQHIVKPETEAELSTQKLEDKNH